MRQPDSTKSRMNPLNCDFGRFGVSFQIMRDTHRAPIGRRRRAATSIILVALAGCGVLDPSCTLIGCASGLILRFSTPPTSAYRIEVTSPGSSAKVVLECPASMGCIGDEAMLVDYLPDFATVTIITATATATTQVKPVYSETSPNGERCGPTCRQATVTVTMPTG